MTKELERELLELAAKAYGLEGWEWDEDMQAMRSPPKATSYGEAHAYWNSRTDDGDALRLAVKLRISIIFFAGFGEVKAEFDGEPEDGIFELYGDDDRAAARLAITRAAAEIGRRLP